MRKKPSPKRKSKLSSPKRKPLKDSALDDAMNTPIKVFTVNGKALTGVLLEYDKDTIKIAPKTYIKRDLVVSMYEEKNAPAKAITGPAVR